MHIAVLFAHVSIYCVHVVPTGVRRCWITELELLKVVYLHMGTAKATSALHW